jgi:hypothetical protein
MKRRLFNAVALCSACSAILFVAVCVFWVRSRSGLDELSLMYCRYLPDRSIVNDEVNLLSNGDGVALYLMHGHAPPRPVDLVRGYDINADQTYSRPRVWFQSEPYDGLTNLIHARMPLLRSPFHLTITRRHQPKDIDDSLTVGVVISHWLLAVLLQVTPVLWLKQLVYKRRTHKWGLCIACGYDLRATPDRRPECGTTIAAKA